MKRLHARQGSPPTRVSGQVDRVPRLGGIAFYQVNGSSRAIPACRDKINHEGMAARGEFFRSYHLPESPAGQNDSQPAEINVIDESQAENRPVPVQEAEIRWKKVSLVGRFVHCSLVAAQKIVHAFHPLSRLGELYVKAGYVSTLLAG